MVQRTTGSICKTLEDGRKLCVLDFEFQQDGAMPQQEAKNLIVKLQ